MLIAQTYSSINVWKREYFIDTVLKKFLDKGETSLKKIFFTTLIAVAVFGTAETQAYTGRLKCSNLQKTLVQFSALHVKSFCKEAIQACRIQEMLDRLDKKHPLHKVLDGRIQEKNSLALEVCELAFLDHDPAHYDEYLKRPESQEEANSKKAPK